MVTPSTSPQALAELQAQFVACAEAQDKDVPQGDVQVGGGNAWKRVASPWQRHCQAGITLPARTGQDRAGVMGRAAMRAVVRTETF